MTEHSVSLIMPLCWAACSTAPSLNNFFAQDHWTVRPNLAFDGGARIEHQDRTSTVRLAPRIGAAWSPLPHDPMVLRGGFGVFYDRVPLSVYSFGHRPEQIVTVYDSSA